MAETNQLVVFSLDDHNYALPLQGVERIVRAVEITHLPEGQGAILGVINVEGRVIPVINTRRRLGLPERDLEPQDLFIILTKDGHSAALVVDDVKPVQEIPREEVVESQEVLPSRAYSAVEGVAKVSDGMIVILTPDKAFPLFDSQPVLNAGEELKGSPL
jgi:purine-binding chemotaxis protein CheW